MRDEYIRLIKEYIKLKPEYKHTLEEIKANVFSVGATEEEFDEAIKQITGLPSSSRFMSINEPALADTQPEEEKKQKKSFGFKNKKVIGTTAGILVFLLLILSFLIFPIKTEKKITQGKINVASAKKDEAQKIIPAVFANTQPINVEKTFSYPKSNVPLIITGKPKKEVLGFFPYWMLDKADDIDLRFLTSVSLFGIEIDGKGGMVTADSDGQIDGGWNMWNDSRLDSFIRKAKNQGIKVFITLKAFNNDNIESLTTSDDAQKNFISNAVYMVNSKNLDGINLDFEYVGVPPANVKKAFVRMVTNLNAELKRQVPGSELTIDTYLSSGSTDTLFDITLLAQTADSFVIMGYDMHTPLGPAGPIAAMGGDTNVIGYLQGYLEKVPADKLILAVPYYGYDWPKTDNSAAQILSYAEIADASSKYKIHWDDITQTPSYIYNVNAISHEVHFDNVRSLGIKYDFINKKNLRGVGIWALGYDGENSELEKLIIDKFSN